MSQSYVWPVSASSSNPSIGANGAPIPGSSTLIAGEGPTGLETPVSVDSSGNVNVNIVGSGGITNPLPTKDAADGTTGAASPSIAIQVGGSDGTDLRALNVDATGKPNINNISGTVSLPTGASTSALQTSGNASLTSIDSKLNTLGQKTMAASAPVVIASDQSTIPVSVASVPLPTGAATEATLAAFSAKTAGAFVPEAFDYAAITYVGVSTDINTVTYKIGGAGGTTVATLTMGYDGSDRLISVTKT